MAQVALAGPLSTAIQSAAAPIRTGLYEEAPSKAPRDALPQQ
jgi:hypothetical protein